MRGFICVCLCAPVCDKCLYLKWFVLASTTRNLPCTQNNQPREIALHFHDWPQKVLLVHFVDPTVEPQFHLRSYILTQLIERTFCGFFCGFWASLFDFFKLCIWYVHRDHFVTLFSLLCFCLGLWYFLGVIDTLNCMYSILTTLRYNFGFTLRKKPYTY